MSVLHRANPAPTKVLVNVLTQGLSRSQRASYSDAADV